MEEIYMDLTIKELKDMFQVQIDLSIIDELIGKDVFIRTTTHYYTGHAVSRDSMFLKLEIAAWIAYDGRFSESMKNAENFSGVEPYNKPISINLYSILDIGELSGKLPTKVK